MMIEMHIQGKGLRLDVVERLIKEVLVKKYPATIISARKEEVPTSRPERFSAAIGQVESAQSEIESLRDELQEWHDNLPENLQSSQKADDLENAVSELEQVISDCENITGASVDFPGMY